MNRYSKVLIVAILAFSLTSLFAGNSIFSRYGFPVENDGYDIYGMGMGNTGSGDFMRMNQGVGVNPALSSISSHVLLATGIKMGNTTYKDVADNSFRDDSFDFPFFSLQMPIKKHHFAFQFTSLMSGNLKSESTSTVDIDGTDYEMLIYESIYSYLYRADLMYSYKFNHFSIGVGANYYLGNRKTKFTQDFVGVGPDIDTDNLNSGYDTFYETSDAYKNPGFMAGLGMRFSHFSFGASYHSAVDLDDTRKYSGILNSYELENNTFKLPQTIIAGVSTKPMNTLKANVDFKYEIWEESDVYTDPQNSWRVGFGVAYEPLSGEDKFFRKIPLRAGYSLKQLPFKVNGSNVMESTITGGFSMPIKAIFSRIDVAYQLTQRGNADDNNVEEISHMFMIGMSGFDIFRKRIKRDQPRDIPIAEELY